MPVRIHSNDFNTASDTSVFFDNAFIIAFEYVNTTLLCLTIAKTIFFFQTGLLWIESLRIIWKSILTRFS